MAEKEYIEKRKLIEAWEREIEDATDLRDAFDFALEDVPAADVVEVVRCKDCKYRETSECSMVFYETIWWDDDGYLETDTITHDNTEDDGFCSYGERKEATP